MPSVALYNIAGQEIGTVKLSDEIFAHEVNQAALHTVVRAYLANQRQGTQSALTRIPSATSLDLIRLSN